MKRFKYWILLAGLVIAVIAIKYFWSNNEDITVGIVNDTGMNMVNISRERRVVNILKVSGESEVWIPEGLGWYRSDKVQKLLELEKKKELLAKIFFYNFGFLTDRICFSDNWEKCLNRQEWIRYKLDQGKLMEGEEELEGDLIENEQKVLEIMPRDMALVKTLEDKTRVTVINESGINGMANFISKRLEMAGILVISVETGTEQREESCQLSVANKENKSKTIEIIERGLGCDTVLDQSLDQDRVELRIGGKFAEMIKYQSYVRTF
jgi:hypothetical protein